MQFDLESALLRLKQDFIEGSLEKLDDIDTIIDNIYNDRGDRGEQFFQLQRDVHSIKGSAGTHGMHLLTLVAHRLEDFIEAAPRLKQEQWRSVQIYIDELRTLVDMGKDPSAHEREQILARLPHAQDTATEFSNQKSKKVTVLVVMPPGVQRKVIGKELASCGFDLSFTDRPVEAIRLVMDLQPDAVLANQEFRNMTGSELGRVLREIKLTEQTPFALLTSSDGHENDLPPGSHIIKKGESFVSDLTEYLVEIGLFGKL
ncbi:Hpt domain-containing protein [Terasakiella pusilla]|jgi:chemotaxis protein histidine kinase CheA|uniref:Hpt domain-containing protein n=1 Tax=Terasakiella pusilla TaxID=64973 RepID=UPI003AA7F975